MRPWDSLSDAEKRLFARMAPRAFVGGTIDVSGEAFEDLAMEARAAFARQ